MSQMSEAIDTHVTRLQSFAGETVTYRRGSSSVTLTAVRGQSDFDEIIGESETTVHTRTVDFLFDATELRLGGQSVEPTRGDQIVAGEDVYDIAPGVQTAIAQWNDGRRNLQRVHTVRRRGVTS